MAADAVHLPHPPSLQVDPCVMDEAMRRLGVRKEELLPVRWVDVAKKGLPKEVIDRRVALKERSRLKLVALVDGEAVKVAREQEQLTEKANSKASSPSLTMQEMAAGRIHSKRVHVRNNVVFLIAKKTNEIKKQKEQRRFDADVMREKYARLEEERKTRRAADERRKANLVNHEKYLQEMQQRREAAQQQKCEQVMLNERRRHEVCCRRNNILAAKVLSAAECHNESMQANKREKAVQGASKMKELLSSQQMENTKLQKAQEYNDNRTLSIRERFTRKHTREQQALTKAKFITEVERNKAVQKICEQEWKQREWQEGFAEACMGLQAAQQDAEYRRKRAAKRKQQMVETEREKRELYNAISDKFCEEHMKVVDSCRQESLDVLSHKNAEKLVKARRARDRQRHSEEQIRNRAATRQHYHSSRVAELDHCWNTVFDHGRVVKEETSKVLSPLLTHTMTPGQQVTRLRGILERCDVPADEEAIPPRPPTAPVPTSAGMLSI